MIRPHPFSAASPLSWSKVLPNQFDFYHLGPVQLYPSVAPPHDNSLVYFKIYGQPSVMLVCSFPSDVPGALAAQESQEVDFSMYAELGNILASWLTTYLTEGLKSDFWISAPAVLSAMQFKSWVKHYDVLLERTYVHHFFKNMTLIHVFIFNCLDVGEGNA